MLLSKTYQTTTPESVENGDFAETGFIFENEEYSFTDLINLINNDGYCHTSDYPANSHSWISTEDEVENYATGENIQYSLHFNGPEKQRKYWEKALKYFNLI